MSKIVFLNNPDKVYDGQFSQIGAHQVRLVFTDAVPVGSDLVSGFDLVNEYNGFVQTERHDYTYIYRTYEDNAKMIELCNDNLPWVKPDTIVTFSAGFGGTLEGELSQKVEDYSQLVIPTPVANENYEFVQWNPAIPTEGAIDGNKSYVAEFVYVKPIEEVRAAKIQEFNTICTQTIEAGQDIKLADGTITHFDYTQYNQTNLANGVNVALNTKEAVPYYDSNNHCHLFSAIDMVTIYTSCQGYITYLLTLDHQLEETINKMTDKDAIANLTFALESLDKECLADFNSIIAQATLVVEKYIENAKTILGV